jgi:hypothetical protein
MAIEWLDSFGPYATAQGPLRYSAATIVAAQGPRGGGVLRVGSTVVVKQLTAVATRVVGFRFRMSGGLEAINMVAFRDAGSAQCDVRLLVTGAMQATRNGTVLGTSAAGVVQSGSVWQYIEVKATTDQIGFQGTGNQSFDFADLYILNTSGSVNNDFWGDTAVDAKTVSGAGNSTQWTPSAGSNYQNVDDATPNGDTDYNSSGTASQVDLYALTDLSGTGTARAAQWNGYVRKDDAGSRSVAPMLRSESTDAQGSTQSVSDSYTYLFQVYDVDPADAGSWTFTKINALEAGIKLVS